MFGPGGRRDQLSTDWSDGALFVGRERNEGSRSIGRADKGHSQVSDELLRSTLGTELVEEAVSKVHDVLGEAHGGLPRETENHGHGRTVQTQVRLTRAAPARGYPDWARVRRKNSFPNPAGR